MNQNQIRPPYQQLSGERLRRFEEGAGLIFARWSALQMAIDNEWGGRNSRQKSQQMLQEIVTWLGESPVHRYIDEVEERLDENMLLSFSTEIEDGSVEEVAEQLMLLHEECQQGIYDMLSDLQNTQPAVPAAPRHQEIARVSEEESSDEEDEIDNEMNIDLLPVQQQIPVQQEVPVLQQENVDNIDGPSTEKLTIEEGWEVVQSKNRRRNRRA